MAGRAAGTTSRRVALALCVMAALSVALASSISLVMVQPVRAEDSNRPPQSVALARVAVVRVLTYYYGISSTSPAPVPVLTPCASDGAIIGTTGANLNTANYVLLPTAAVNPLAPCQGVVAAFQQLHGAASDWGITGISVVLDIAYTGTSDSQRGSITYSISPGLLTTNGGAGAPRLLALALSNDAGSPDHDVPVLTVPQPSDAPATGATQVIDLTGHNGQPLNRDAVQQDEINDTLYPISVPASQIPQAPGGSVGKATASSGAAANAAVTPTALANSMAVGAVAVDSNGRLVGMVVPDSNGNHVLAPLSEVKQAIGPITGQSGLLMTAWQKGIASFYASPADYSAAATSFHTVLSEAPDFAGAQPFLDAAQQQQANIPSLTQSATPTPGNTIDLFPTPVGISARTLLIVGGGAVATLLVLILLLVLLARRRQRTAKPSYAPMPLDESGLDLLPRDSMYAPSSYDPYESYAPRESFESYESESYDPYPSEEFAAPQSIPAVRPPQPRSQPRPSAPLEDQPTGVLPAMRPAPAGAGPTARPAAEGLEYNFDPRAPTQSRKNTNLMSYAAGLTHPGIRRARDPNQDNMLALHGVRMSGARQQPYGLYIVADGMGGHLNGQEASRLAIEIVTRTCMQVLNTSQPLDGPALAGLLRDGLQRANDELRRRNRDERADMGTTMTAALIVDDQAAVLNVGDSRTYLMSPESGLRQITTDHSVVASLVSAGVIRPEDVYTHPRRNQIYRSLGGEEEQVEADVFPVTLQAGDKLLLCSDGLWEMVRDPQIEHILRASADPQQAVQLLVREANTNGGEDNISALVVRLVDDLPRNAQPGMEVIVAPSASTGGSTEAAQPQF